MQIRTDGQSIATLYTASKVRLEYLASRVSESIEAPNALGDERQLWRNEIQRLELWASQHDVEKGKLDHTFDADSPQKEQVLTLLEALHHLNAPSSRSHASSRDGNAVIAHESVSENGEPTFDVIRNLVENGAPSSSTSLSFDLDVSVTTSEPATLGRQILDRAHSCITGLLDLSLILTDTNRCHNAAPSRDPVAARPDLEYVDARLPNANEILRHRIGYANWNRRQRLIELRDRHTDSGTSMQYQVKVSDLLGDTDDQKAETSAHTSSPGMLLELKHRPGTPQSISRTLATIDTVPESIITKTTNVESIFTKATTHSSLTKSSQTSSVHTNTKEELEPPAEDGNLAIASQPIAMKLRIPDPPSPNHKLSGASFLCPYCFWRIDELTSMDEWCEHLFVDLRPYVCTFSGCTCPGATYASKTAWWNHEYTHRVQSIWECAPCSEQKLPGTFDSYRGFSDHAKVHKNMDARQIRRVAQVCERQTSVSEVSHQCPLCQAQIPCPEATADIAIDDLSQQWEDTICNHIANHLEQIALFVALPTGNLDAEPDILVDDSDSEYDEKDDIQSILDVQSHISDRRNQSKQEVAAANVARFFDDQSAFVDPFNMPPTETQRARIPIGTDNDELLLRLSRSPQSPMNLMMENTKWPVVTNLRPRNEFYAGNDALLQEVQTHFRKRGTVLVLSGLGGVGKTQAAVEFCYRYLDNFECVFWLQADTDAGLTQSFVEIPVQLGIDVRGETQLQDIQRGRNWLSQTNRRWLMVIDNAWQWAEISQYIPNQFVRCNGSVLITSQNDRIAAVFKSARVCRMSPLSPHEGAGLLLKYLNKKDAESDDRVYAEEISSFVGGLPVALAHVAAYAEQSQFDLEEVIEVFREWRRVAQLASDEADDLPASFRQAAFVYDDVLRMVYNITLRALSQDAQDLANILAYLNSEEVPEEMIWRIHSEPTLKFLDVREKMRMKTTKKQLTQRRLVQIRDINGKQCLSMHRALQRSIRRFLADRPHKQQKVFDQAVSLVYESLPSSSPTQQPGAGDWDAFKRLLPHIASLREVYKLRRTSIVGTIDLVKILSQAGVTQWERGATRDGLESLRTAEMALDPAGCGPDDPQRADIHITIALMHDNAGLVNRQEALDRRQQAYQVRQAKGVSTRVEDTLLHNALMDLAISHLQCHDYKKAEGIIEQCLKKYREWGTAEQIPYEYAKYYDNMSLVRLYQRRFDDAISLARQALDWTGRVKSFELESRQIFTLACIYLQSGKIKDALRWHQDVHDGRLEHYGSSNELTLHSKHALGAIAEMEGRYEDAEALFTEILTLCDSSVWQVEALNRTKYHLSQVKRAMSKFDEANKLEEESTTFLHALLMEHEGEYQGLMPDSSDAVLFDHIITVSARFTSVGLLESVI